MPHDQWAEPVKVPNPITPEKVEAAYRRAEALLFSSSAGAGWFVVGAVVRVPLVDGALMMFDGSIGYVTAPIAKGLAGV